MTVFFATWKQAPHEIAIWCFLKLEAYNVPDISFVSMSDWDSFWVLSLGLTLKSICSWSIDSGSGGISPWSSDIDDVCPIYI